MKINYTYLLIFVVLAIALYFIYNYYFSSTLKHEGFETTQPVASNTISAYSDEKSLINIRNDNTYFDIKTGNLIFSIDNGASVEVMTPNSNTIASNITKNIYVIDTTKHDSYIDSIKTKYRVATDVSGQTDLSSNDLADLTTREEIDISGSDVTVINTISGELPYDDAVPENFYTHKFTDGNKLVTIYFAKTNAFSVQSKYPFNLILTEYDNVNKKYSIYNYSSNDGTTFYLSSVVDKTIDFTSSSTNISDYNSTTNSEETSTFSAIVSQYNLFASLKPITDSVFFDPLNYNFIQYEKTNDEDRIIIYDIRGDPTTYKNEKSNVTLNDVTPWTLVDNKNKVLLFIKPSELATSTNNLPIRIISIKDDMLYYSHFTNIPLSLDDSVYERIRNDRSNALLPKPSIYYSEYNGQEIPSGAAFKCLKNGVRYWSYNGEHCPDGDLITDVIDGDTSGNYVETYDLSVNVPPNHVSDYYKWMWYWKSKKYEEHNGLTDYSDYILKSSVVPPVCPSCPSCPNCPDAGVCTNCGGQGGNGTRSSSNTLLHLDNDGDGIIDNTFEGANKLVSGTIDTAGNVGSELLDATGNVVEKTGDAAKGAIGSTWDALKGATGEVYGAAKDATGEVYGAAKDATGEVYGEAKEVGGEIYQEGKEAGRNIGDAIDRRRHSQMDHIHSGSSVYHGHPVNNDNVNTYVGPEQRGQQKIVNPAISSMNYFGALPAKGHDNYMPITADFSSFGR